MVLAFPTHPKFKLFYPYFISSSNIKIIIFSFIFLYTLLADIVDSGKNTLSNTK